MDFKKGEDKIELDLPKLKKGKLGVEFSFQTSIIVSPYAASPLPSIISRVISQSFSNDEIVVASP